jgi:phosphoribosyl-AMP cyclohydrolase
MNELEWLDQIAWTAEGLIPVIAQDHATGQVLMFAWMNRDALQETVKRKRAVYWSRSRQKLWAKGEESGHVQTVHDIRLDCDDDVILLSVSQAGGIACHTGRCSCFYQTLVLDESAPPRWQNASDSPVLKDPNSIYGAT